jgi:heptosyltransferase-1
LRRNLRRERIDVSLDPQGLTKSGLVAWLSGARRRIGFARPAAREFNPWLQTARVVSRAAQRVDRYLELLRPLGIEKAGVRFGISIPPAAEQVAEELAARAELRGGYAVINPGAGWDSKRWPVERFALVAGHLGSHRIPWVVTWGGEPERGWAEAIVSQSRGAAVIAPATSLVELAAVLRKARLFVGSDTGPLHLAAAMGTPCVAMFGASAAEACGPYGTGHVVLQAALDESPGRKKAGADNWAMRMIGAGAVCEACDRVLSRGEQTKARESRAA